jgi:hypothetical protein
MGLFDRFTGKKPSSPSPTPAAASPTPSDPAPAAPEVQQPQAARTAPIGTISEQLAAAVAKLEANDLEGALAIYEPALQEAGDRADVLVSVSGELGSRGHVGEIIQLVAPLYDAERHGPATGLNLLQAYLAVHDTDAAQHMLDVLFALKRPELEERLYGFSNALAELLIQTRRNSSDATAAPANTPRVSLISISKPIWSYGLEAIASEVLPPKDGKLRNIAFAQLAVLGLPDYVAAMQQPETELGRLARGIPLWFAETFYLASGYSSFAAVGLMTMAQQPPRPMIFGNEWTVDNLRQLVETTSHPIDYIVTGALRVIADDFELTLRIHEVKGFRERKKIVARWTPATADAELAKIQAEIRRYMEWHAAGAPLPYREPRSPVAWVDTLSTSLGTFLVEKAVLQSDRLPTDPDLYATAGDEAADRAVASLAYLTLVKRAKTLGVAVEANAPLASDPVVEKAKAALGL